MHAQINEYMKAWIGDLSTYLSRRETNGNIDRNLHNSEITGWYKNFTY